MSDFQAVSYVVDFKFDASDVLKSLKKIREFVKDIFKSLERINFSGAFSGLSEALGGINSTTEALRTQREELERIRGLQRETRQDRASSNEADNFNLFDGIGENFNKGLSNSIKSTLSSSWKEALSQFTSTDFELRSGVSKSAKGLKEQMEVLKKYDKLSKEVGGATIFSNFDIAEGINAAAALGVAKEKMDGFIKSSAEFAQAHKMTLSDAITISKKALNTFNLDLSESDKMLDTITAISNNSSASVRSLGSAFSYVGSTAVALKRPVASVSSLIAALNNVGFDGTRAGTALDSIYKAFNNFAKKSKIEEIIGSITDAAGDLIPEKEIIARLQKAKSAVSSVDFAAVMSDIFGDVGGRGMMALVNTNIKELERLENVAKSSAGSTASSAAFMMDGIGGKVETLTGNLSSMFSIFISNIEPVVSPVIKAFTQLSDSVGDLLSKNPEMAKFVFTIIALAGARVKIISLYKAFMSLKEAKGVIGMLKASLNSLSTGLGLAALAGVLTVLKSKFDIFMKTVRSNAETSKLFDSTLSKLKDTAITALTVMGEFVLALFGVDTGTQETAGAFKNFTQGAGSTSSELARAKDILLKLSDNLDIFKKRLEGLSKWISENKGWLKFAGYAVIVGKAISLITGAVESVIAVISTLGAVAGGVISGPFVAVIATIAGAFVYLYTRFDGFRDFINSIPGWIAGVLSTITDLPSILLQGVVSFITSSFNFVKDTIVSIVDFSIKTVQALLDILHGDFSSAASRFNPKEKKYKPSQNNEGYSITDAIMKHSQGTDYLRKGQNLTTTDEHGHEAIWLPEGSMIARNSTTSRMDNNLNEIRKRPAEEINKSNIVNNIHIYVNSTDTAGAAREIENELRKLRGY